jgi:hypothetical protein
MEITEQHIIEGLALGAERFFAAVFSAPEDRAALIQAVAEAKTEVMDTEQAAAFLGFKAARTLAENHVGWGIDRSTALGPTEPRYLRSQLLEALKARRIKGRAKAATAGQPHVLPAPSAPPPKRPQAAA